MTYDAREREVGDCLLVQDQKIAQIDRNTVCKSECSCSNGGNKVLLNGIWVKFLSPSCKIHSRTELKWLVSAGVGQDH